MSLIKLDSANSLLKRIGDFPFDGALPEMAIFDNSSRFVAVTGYGQFDDPKGMGSIGFWRIEEHPFDPDRIVMVKTNQSIAVMRGPHSMVIVR